MARRNATPPQALGEFCRREGPRLAGSLFVVVGDVDTADDLAQEALVRACANWAKVNRMNSPEGWLYRVAFNLVRSGWRHQRVAAAHAAELTPPGAADDAALLALPETLALRDVLADLSTVERNVLVLRFCADLPVATVAEVLGLSVSGVKTHTSRGLTKARANPHLPRPDLSLPEEETYVRF